MTWVLTLAESAFDYLCYREAEALVAKRPSSPVLQIMDRLAEHQLASRFWNTVFLASSAALVTALIEYFVNNVWLSAAGGIAVMAVIILLFAFRSASRVGAIHYGGVARVTAGPRQR